jgi:ketosteroid isomerase-like protein
MGCGGGFAMTQDPADSEVATTGVPDPDALAVVEAFGAAWADHDLVRALSFLTEDCVFEATGPAPDGVRHVGQAAIGEAWSSIFADRSSRFVTEESIAAGDRVIQRWRYEWADGHVRGVDVYALDGDRISQKLSYVKG